MPLVVWCLCCVGPVNSNVHVLHVAETQTLVNTATLHRSQSVKSNAVNGVAIPSWDFYAVPTTIQAEDSACRS